MPTAREHLSAGRLDEAIEQLGVELRSNPTDAQRRAFLFELLAFAGNHDRAARQLDVLAGNGPQAEIGAMLYRAALDADRVRRHMFETHDVPPPPAERPLAGTLNGSPFASLADADPRIGARLEVYAAGRYMYIPLEHVASVRIQQPARLRDLLWTPAIVRTGPGFNDRELGEVLLPVLTPTASRHPDPQVRLGRVTEWEELPDGSVAPVGQKLFLVDGEEVPLLEVRELELTPAAEPVS